MTPPKTRKSAESTRPSLARKHTPSSEENRKARLEQGLAVTIDGQRYEVRLGDVTPMLARQTRQYTGYGPLQLISSVASSPDVDTLSAFVWLARRVAGEVVAFEKVQVTYGQMLADDFDMDLPEEADDDPEA